MNFVRSLWGVRYQVKDVSRSADFYTQHLGFTLDFKNPPAFAQVSNGQLKLILSGPGASGSRANFLFAKKLSAARFFGSYLQ